MIYKMVMAFVGFSEDPRGGFDDFYGYDYEENLKKSIEKNYYNPDRRMWAHMVRNDKLISRGFFIPHANNWIWEIE